MVSGCSPTIQVENETAGQWGWKWGNDWLSDTMIELIFYAARALFLIEYLLDQNFYEFMLLNQSSKVFPSFRRGFINNIKLKKLFQLCKLFLQNFYDHLKFFLIIFAHPITIIIPPQQFHFFMAMIIIR